MRPVAVLCLQLSVRGQFQDGCEDISVHCQYLTVPLMLLPTLYDRSCMVPLNRLPCYDALEIILTALLIIITEC